jgi:hypothetical protein
MNPIISPAEVQALAVRNGRLSRKVNKFGVSPACERTYGGVTYASRREMEVAQALDVQLACGLLKRVDRQVRYPLVVNGVKICTYVADFKVLHQDGSVETIEVKGKETAVWKLKERLFRALYKGAKLTVVK